MSTPPLHIALLNPEIPGNTGNIGRLCAGVGARLHLVHPLGFDTSAKAVRRAGLDYWSSVDVQEHDDEHAFFAWAQGRQIVALSAHGRRSFTSVEYQEGVVLLFGRESVGLPPEVVERYEGVRIPAPGPIRSLNLSNAVAVVAYHALHGLRPDWFA